MSRKEEWPHSSFNIQTSRVWFKICHLGPHPNKSSGCRCVNQICLAGCQCTHRHTLHWHTCLSLLTFCEPAATLVPRVVYYEWFQTAGTGSQSRVNIF